MTIKEQLEGWGFDMGALSASESMKEGEGALSSQPPKAPRAFSTNVSNDPTQPNELKEDEWCNYANMPSPKAYM